ncbi:MAG: hypothetical protein E7134_07645 [Rikenellaceae bacterium]|nr:hypothetical protein [Rikenellaceae bacterium]
MMKKIFALVAAALMLSACGEKPNEGPTPQGGQLAKPAGVAVVEETITTTSAEVNWQPVENATGYDYRLLASATMVASGNTDQPSVKFENLTANTAYRFEVRALGNDKEWQNSQWNSSLEFTTLLRDQAEDGSLQPSVIVAADGSGDYTKVADAIGRIPKNNQNPFVIYVKEGVYKEKLLISKGYDNVVLVGDGRGKTVITYDDCQGTYNGADSSLPETQRRSYTLRVESQGVAIMDMTIENTHQNNTGSGDQAMAVEVKYGKVSFFDCDITGYQDTFLGRDDSARVYVKDSLVEGNVDFIYGASVMVFDGCQINVNRDGAAITAPSTSANAPYGIVFLDCDVTADEMGFNGAKVNNIYLGRAWHYAAKSVWVRCKMAATLNADGWMANMNDDVAEASKIFAEWGCTYADSADSDLTKRKNGGRALTDDEAAGYTLANIFADVDNLEAFTTKPAVKLN